MFTHTQIINDTKTGQIKERKKEHVWQNKVRGKSGSPKGLIQLGPTTRKDPKFKQIRF